MHVNELAKLAGAEAHVVRYYTQTGLLSPRRNPNNRYREYRDTDVSRLRFIRRARRLGFTLQDITAILGDADMGRSPCAKVRDIIRKRSRDNQERLQELARLQARMDKAIELWESMPDRPPDHECLCHLIDAVSKDDSGLT